MADEQRCRRCGWYETPHLDESCVDVCWNDPDVRLPGYAISLNECCPNGRNGYEAPDLEKNPNIRTG